MTTPATGKLDVGMPASTPHARNKSAWLFAAFIALVCLRLPAPLIHPSLFAEEGTHYFAYAWHMPWRDALLNTVTGYLNIAASAATLLARIMVTEGFITLETAPRVTVSIALLIQACPALLILANRDPWLARPWAKPAALALLALAPVSEEVWYHVIHSQFHLTLCAALICASSVPPSVRGKAARLVLVVLAPLSGPGAIALLPVMAMRTWIERTRDRGVELAAFAGAALIQVLFFYRALPFRSFRLDVQELSAIVAVRHVALPLGTPDRADELRDLIAMLSSPWSTIVPAIICLAALGPLAMAARNWREPAATLLASAVLIGAVSYIGALAPPGALLLPYAGARYSFVPQVLLGLTLVAIAATNTGLTRRIAGTVIVIIIGASLVFWHRPDPMLASGPSWTNEVQQWRANPEHILAGWPAGWVVDLSPATQPCQTSLRAWCPEAWLERQRRDAARR